VLRNWEAIKKQEKAQKQTGDSAGENPASLLDGVSAAMPGLLEAQKLGSRASKVGFDWPDVEGLFEKLQEEIQELQRELKQSPDIKAVAKEPAEPTQSARESLHNRIEEEVGDLFFVLVNLARHLSVDPESALKKTNRKFRRRFQWMERQLWDAGKRPDQANREELELQWQRAKEEERIAPKSPK
jgi:ATP diphosphatase